MKQGTSDVLCRGSRRSEGLSAFEREVIYRRSCCECVLLAPLLGVFILMQATYTSMGSSFFIDRTLKFEFLQKRFGKYNYKVKDVHDEGLFWEWFDTFVEETLMVQHDQLGSPLPRSEWGYVGRYNKIVGGVRMYQDRGSRTPCPKEPTEWCYGPGGDGMPFGRAACGSASADCYNSQRYVGFVDTEGDEGFVVDPVTRHFEFWLDPLEPKESLRKRVQYLKDRHWIDKQTRFITIVLITQNVNFEPLLSEAQLLFTFDRTGYILETAHIDTVPVDPYSSNALLKIALGTSYILLNILLALGLIGKFISAWVLAYNATRSLWTASKQALLRNVVEVINIAAAVMQMAFWLAFAPASQRLMQKVSGAVRPECELMHNATDAAAWHRYHHEIADVKDDLEWCLQVIQGLRSLSTVTLLCIMLRSLKVWDGIPAFASLTRTLTLSANRLGAILLSAGGLLSLFAGAAMLNFGTQLQNFSTIKDATQNTAVIAITGDATLYSEMSYIDPIFTAFWFWALISVMFMVVLNLVLGVLVEAAAVADSASKDANMSLQQQFFIMVLSYWRCVTRQAWCSSSRDDEKERAKSWEGSEHETAPPLDLESLPTGESCAAEAATTDFGAVGGWNSTDEQQAAGVRTTLARSRDCI